MSDTSDRGGMRRRTFLRAWSIVTLAIAGGPSLLQSTASAAPARQQRAAQQTIRFATTGQIASGFFPAGFASEERVMLSNIFLPPLVRDKDHNLHPGLLASYQPNTDGSAWTLQLDPRVTWSDGSKLNAADVKAGWEWTNAPLPEGVQLQKFFGLIDRSMDNIQGQKEHRAGQASDMSGIQVIDDQTLTVTLNRPDYIFPQKLAVPTMGVMKAAQANNDPFVFQKPECLVNGPYYATTYDPDGKQYVFEPNPNWWGDPVTVRRVEFLTDLQESTQYTMWQNNEIDVAAFFGPVLNQLYAGPDKDLVVYHPYGGIAWGLFLNVTKDPASDLNLRKAMLHSVDTIGIIKAVFGDTQRASIGIVPPELPCWTQRDATYPYDVGLAKSFLAQSKYGSAANVPPMQLAIWWDEPLPQFDAIVEQWRTNLGLRVEIVKDKTATTPNPQKEYDLTLWSIGAIIPDAVLFSKSAMIFKGGGAWPQSHYDNPQVDTILENAEALPASDGQRCALVSQGEQLVLNDYAVMPVQRVTYRHFVKPWVNGWVTNVDLSPYTLPSIYVADH
ncbi:MAG: ABC transporter substrate-binding protein [Chloroflexota bacterium]|nr:ABC transporter substrate-binding protein [Chloroflexota bacterium]